MDKPVFDRAVLEEQRRRRGRCADSKLGALLRDAAGHDPCRQRGWHSAELSDAELRWQYLERALVGSTVLLVASFGVLCAVGVARLGLSRVLSEIL